MTDTDKSTRILMMLHISICSYIHIFVYKHHISTIKYSNCQTKQTAADHVSMAKLLGSLKSLTKLFSLKKLQWIKTKLRVMMTYWRHWPMPFLNISAAPQCMYCSICLFWLVWFHSLLSLLAILGDVRLLSLRINLQIVMLYKLFQYLYLTI